MTRLLRRGACALLALVSLLPASAGQDASPAPDPGPGADARAEYAAGLAAWEGGEPERAASFWRAALELEQDAPTMDPASLRMALGAAAFERGDVHEAAAWFTAAVRAAPRDRDAWHNLELARTAAELGPADRGDLAATLDRVLGAWTPREAGGFALLAAIVATLCAAWHALRGGTLARRVALCAFFGSLVCALPWARSLRSAPGRAAFVVAANGATLRADPDVAATGSATAPAGETVHVVDELPEWSRVRRADGSDGWCRTSRLFELP